MHQTRKGNPWYFGMTAYIGVDSNTKLIHSIAVTPANVHDLHSWVIDCTVKTPVSGVTRRMRGKQAVLQETAPRAKDFTQKKGFRYKKLSDLDRARHRNKSKVRAKVEHLFGVMKRQFGYNRSVVNTRYLRDHRVG